MLPQHEDWGPGATTLMAKHQQNKNNPMVLFLLQ
jgi:hypothetical protein